MDVIAYPCWYQSYSMLVQAPGIKCHTVDWVLTGGGFHVDIRKHNWFVWLCFVWLSTARSRIHGNYLSIFVRVASVALGSQSITMTSQSASWRVPNQQQLDGLSNYLFKLTSNKTTKIRVIGPLWGQSTGDRWIPLTEGPVMRKAYPLCDVIMHTTLQM